MASQCFRHFTVAVFAIALSACQRFAPPVHEAEQPSPQPPPPLTILHVNDTHSHFDPSVMELPERGKTLVGGYPAIASAVNAARATNDHALFLHAGDAFQGTGYFVLYHGTANADLLSRMHLDAMTIGNHEFDQLRVMNITWSADGSMAEQIVPGDKIPQDLPLSRFAESVNFPLVAANLRVNDDPYLAAITNIKPWIIREVLGEKIGIFGIVLEDMPSISSPGRALAFDPIIESARRAVEQLQSQGVRRIIMLSHIGYAKDCRLAAQVDGIDAIVGGHSHDLLGDFTSFGLPSVGPYPTIVTSPCGDRVCVVQAGAYAGSLGTLHLQFDPEGRVQSWSGSNTLLVLKGPENPSGIEEDPALRALIDDQYKPALLKTYGPVIAQVPVTLTHERRPTDKEGHGSEVAPIAAEAYCAALEERNLPVDAGLVNAGGIRTPIQAGDYFRNQTLMEVMIFGNNLCSFSITGAEIKQVLESVINASLADPDLDGRFPYTARMAYTYDAAMPAGQRITALKFVQPDGTWTDADEEHLYHLVSSAYVGNGNDGYETLKALIDARGTAVMYPDLIDNQLFTAYVIRQSQSGLPLIKLPYTPVTLKNADTETL